MHIAVPVIQQYFSRLMSLEPIRRQALISLCNIIGYTVLGYIATMYLAHVLGPAILGAYYLFFSYFSIFSLIGDGGFGGAATKRISEGKDPDAFFTAYVALRVVLLAISIIAILVISPYLVDFVASGLLPWLILALISGTIAGFAATGVYGSGKVGVTQTSDFLNNVVRIILQILATYLGFAAAGLAAGFVTGMLAGFLINFRFLPLKLAKFTYDHLKSLFSFSFWIFLSSSGSLVFSTADTILIGYFLSNSSVGIYRIAFQLSSIALFICLALNTVLFPRMSRWSSEGNLSSVSAALSRAFSFSLMLAIPVVIGGIILSDRLLYYLYGADFETGMAALIILLLLQLAVIFVTLQVTCLNALDHPRSSFYATSLAAGVNIILNVLLIPFLGIQGAALATLVSMILNGLLSYYYLSRYIPVRLERGTVLRIILSGLVMGIVVLLFRFSFGVESFVSLTMAIILGAGVYFLILFQIDRRIREELAELLRTFGIL
jgi:O-antigen/teichoic acid export membrane protein